MYYLIKDGDILSISDSLDMLRNDVNDGSIIMTQDEYLNSYGLLETAVISEPFITAEKEVSEEDKDDQPEESGDGQDVELNPEYILEALTDIQSQLTLLNEVKDNGNDSNKEETEEAETVAN